MADVFTQLVSLGADPQSGVYCHAGCSDRAIQDMQAAATRALGCHVPAAFVRLLRLSNGLQINSAYFKTAEQLVPENLDCPRQHVIILGNAGNVEEYIYDTQDHQFHITTMGFPAERYATFATLEAMIHAILHQQQVL